MSSTILAADVVGRHREGTPGLVPVAAFGVRRRWSLLAWFRRGRHRLPDNYGATAPAPAIRPAV